jgi:hypothetical protein
MLGLMALAFVGLSYLTAWMARWFEWMKDRGELGPGLRRFRVLMVLGGENMDYSTTALEVCWWNHPVIVLTVLGWAISLTLLRPATMLVTLGLAVYGYTLPLSALDSVRWRPGALAAAATLGGLIAMSVAPQFEGYDWLEKLSVFDAYAPVTVALKGEPLTFNSLVLLGVFVAGAVPAFWIFCRRDLPTNS